MFMIIGLTSSNASTADLRKISGCIGNFHLAFSWTPKQNDRSTNPPQIALTVSPWLLAVQIRETFLCHIPLLIFY